MTSPTTNRRYGVSSGTAIKAPCRVGTTVNITLSGLQTIDGITVVADDRVLVKNQSNTTENGIYVAASGDWVRDVDADGNYDIQNGTTVLVTSGGQAKTFWMFSGTNPITPGSSAITIVAAPQTQPVDVSTSTTIATGGTSTRTIAAYMGDIINIKNYGAVGDGATDDTTAIQAAYTYAGTLKYATVWWPAGSYVMSGVNITGTVGGHIVTSMYGAYITQKVLASNTGTPLFNCKIQTCTFLGGTLYGQKGSQPADGFSDSYNGGANGQGRAYRAGIAADVANGARRVYVYDTYITNMYGAAVATNNVDFSVALDSVSADTCNFELLYATGTGATGANIDVNNCTLTSAYSSDATINSYGVFSRYNVDVRVNNCKFLSCERNFVYVADSSNGAVNIVGNTMSSNMKDTYSAIKLDTTSLPINNAIIANNNIFAVYGGITTTGTNLNLITILGNQIYTTTGTAGDGINVAKGGTINIANNALHDIKRNGISVSGQTLNFICTGNTVYGQAGVGTYALQLNATIGSWPNAVIRNNIFSNFEGSPAGLGLVNFTRSAAYVFTICTFQNNIMLTGSASNKGLGDGGVALLSNGSVTDNSIDGFMSMTSTNVRYVGNLITGTLSMPAATANFDITSTLYSTLGAAAGSYPVLRLNNTNYLVSLFTT